jgi:hypothetical protein
MTWFERHCRNTGLALHNVVHPHGKSSKQEVKRTVEEKKISDKVTLRRTTIEEVEITKEAEQDYAP